MSVATTVARLRDLALSLPRQDCDWEERPQFDSPTPRPQILELAKYLEFNLPADFLDFLLETSAVVGMTVHNGYWIGGIDQMMHTYDNPQIPQQVQSERVGVIGTDGGGNAFLLTASGQIWHRHHETNRVELVAESFGGFLDRIAEDWAAYISERQGWRYLV